MEDCVDYTEAILIQQAKEWLRESHGLNIVITYDGFEKNNKLLKVYSFDIIKGFSKNGCLTKRDDNFSDVLDFSHQDIAGNYINSEKFEEALFKMYGYKTYEEAELEAIRECIKIIKNERLLYNKP